MSNYQAPVQDMRFVLDEIVGFAEIAQLPGYEEATPDLVDAVLDEAAKFTGEVLADILTYRPFIRRGGVTLSGGEPLLQPEFACAVLDGCRESRLHSAVDTSALTASAMGRPCRISMFSAVPPNTENQTKAASVGAVGNPSP